jgi:hypothetical protein
MILVYVQARKHLYQYFARGPYPHVTASLFSVTFWVPGFRPGSSGRCGSLHWRPKYLTMVTGDGELFSGSLRRTRERNRGVSLLDAQRSCNACVAWTLPAKARFRNDLDTHRHHGVLGLLLIGSVHSLRPMSLHPYQRRRLFFQVFESLTDFLVTFSSSSYQSGGRPRPLLSDGPCGDRST